MISTRESEPNENVDI